MAKIEPKIIQVFEYQSIAYKGKHSNASFDETLYYAFENYFKLHERTSYFELIPYGVRFKNYVGVIQVGKVTIEVLPKAGKDGNEKDWQGVLLDMLKTCRLLTAQNTGEAPLKLRSNAVLELYFELFLNELELLLHNGLIKKYKVHEGQQNTLKGALVFSKHVSKNIVHKELFYTRHTLYTQQHLLHEILYEALLIIQQLSNSVYLNDRIGRILLAFPVQKRLKVTAKHFSTITFHRKTEPYKKAFEIAKLLLLNYHPSLSSGRENLLTLMFDMNKLWEEYVFRILRKEKAWNVQRQNRKPFWEKKGIRPDIVLTLKTHPEQCFIIDTKWKVIDSKHPADDDLKQMYVYNHHWNSTKSMLLYPKTRNQESREGIYSLKLKDEIEHSCKIGFVDVLKNQMLNENLSKDIIALIESYKLPTR